MSGVFANGINALNRGEIVIGTDTIRAVLMVSTFAPQYDTHEFFNPISANKASGTSTEKNLTVTSSVYEANDQVQIEHSATSIVFDTVSSGQRIAGILIFRSGADGSADRLLCYCTLSSKITSDGSDVTINLTTGLTGGGLLCYASY